MEGKILISTHCPWILSVCVICDLDHKSARPLSLPLDRIQPQIELKHRCQAAPQSTTNCQNERVAMINDDVVKCPLCGGFTHMENKELLAALKEPRLREQVEKYIAELLKSPVDELSTVGATQAGRDFQKDVRSWNPCVPMWRRSPKE
jgi:hypothetical protein